MTANSVTLLPWPVQVGPYRFTSLLDPPSRFTRPRWLSEADYNHEIIRVRAGLSPQAIALNWWLRVVRAMHYSAGLDDGCPEESFTHAYAAGLIAFIRANPETWVWFNQLVEAQLSPGAKYARYAAGRAGGAERLAPPRQLLVGKSVYQLESMPLELSERLNCWGDCNLVTKVMRLSAELYGTQLAVIFWHELVHAMHREDGLDDGHSRARFARNQATRTIQFMVDNPQAWRWFLCLTSQAENDGRAQQRLRHVA